MQQEEERSSRASQSQARGQGSSRKPLTKACLGLAFLVGSNPCALRLKMLEARPWSSAYCTALLRTHAMP